MQKKYFIFLLLSLLLVPFISSAAPLINSVSGNLLNGQTMTVNGNGFGAKHAPSNYDYFDDYGSNWSCNTADGSCVNPAISSGISWNKLIFGTQNPCTGDCLMTQINGNSLFNIDAFKPLFSTGRSFNEWIEYYDGSSGGLPNGSLQYDFLDANEFFISYNISYNSSWPIVTSYPDTTYCPVDDKQFEVFLSISNQKVYGNWECKGKYSGKYYTLYSVMGDYAISPTCISCNNYNAYLNRTNKGLWNGRGRWQEVKVYMKMNTWTGGAPNSDGIVKIWVDGINIVDDTSVSISGTNGDKFSKLYLIANWSGGTAALNFQSGQEFNVSIDDVLINYSSIDPTGGIFPSTAAVYLSNQSNWNNGSSDKINGDSNFIRQIVGGANIGEYGFNSWSNNQLKFKINTSGLNVSNPIYLYIVNWNGEANPQGYQINATTDTVPPSAPTGLVVN